MKLQWLLPGLGLLSMTLAAQAQVGLYLNPIATHVTTSQADTGDFAFLGQGATSRIFGGVSLGGYYTLAHLPKAEFAIDVRDELEHGNNALLNSFLIGGRLDGRLPRPAFKPYVEVLGGLATTHSPVSPVRANKPAVKVYGGLDYTLSPHIDFRVVEVGYGSVTTISSSLYAATPAVPARLLSFSSGLVFRFGK